MGFGGLSVLAILKWSFPPRSPPTHPRSVLDFHVYLQILEHLPPKDVSGDVGDVEEIGAAKETLRKAHDVHRGKIFQQQQFLRVSNYPKVRRPRQSPIIEPPPSPTPFQFVAVR